MNKDLEDLMGLDLEFDTDTELDKTDKELDKTDEELAKTDEELAKTDNVFEEHVVKSQIKNNSTDLKAKNTDEPEVKESEPEVKESEPQVKESEPEVKESEPEVKESEPEVKESEPQVKESEPQILENEEPQSMLDLADKENKKDRQNKEASVKKKKEFIEKNRKKFICGACILIGVIVISLVGTCVKNVIIKNNKGLSSVKDDNAKTNNNDSELLQRISDELKDAGYDLNSTDIPSVDDSIDLIAPDGLNEENKDIFKTEYKTARDSGATIAEAYEQAKNKAYGVEMDETGKYNKNSKEKDITGNNGGADTNLGEKGMSGN